MDHRLQSWLLFASSVILLIAGGWLAYTGQAMVITSACVRSGAMLFAVWLALPQLRKFTWTSSTWFVVSAIICGVTLVVRAKALVFVVPILLLLGALQFVRWLFAPMPKQARKKEAKPPANRGEP